MMISKVNGISFKGSYWNEKIKYPNGIEYLNWVDGEDYFCKYMIDNPNGIISDLEQCKKDFKWTKRIDKSIEFIQGSRKFLNERIFGIVGLSHLTTVFDIGNDRVLKISEENPFEYRKHNPKFDIPLIGTVEEYNGFYGYIQRKADTSNIGLNNVLEVKRKMRKAGFIPSADFSDYRIDQIGVYNGESFLLDSRCAVKQNNLLTRFTKWFEYNFNQEIILISPDLDADVEIKHVDEKPLPNYTIKEAYARIKKVIRSWK